VSDARLQLNYCGRLLGELSRHILDDAEDSVSVFRYSSELIKFMNEHEVYDATKVRDLLHDMVEEALNQLDAEQGAA
jgi:uncharacterized protein YrzB (UPF0473 family)